METRITIVEDNYNIRTGLKDMLDTVSRYNVVNTYTNCEDALENLDRDKPDVVLMDIGLPKMSGIEGTRAIRKKLPGCIILIITVFDNSENVFKSLVAGASGYIIKNADFKSIVSGIEDAMAGGAPMSLSISRMVIESFQTQNTSPLSERENEVLQRISEGKSYTRIAEEMFISKETVKTHTKNIYRKLEVSSKEGAIRMANTKGWVKPPFELNH